MHKKALNIRARAPYLRKRALYHTQKSPTHKTRAMAGRYSWCTPFTANTHTPFKSITHAPFRDNTVLRSLVGAVAAARAVMVLVLEVGKAEEEEESVEKDDEE